MLGKIICWDHKWYLREVEPDEIEKAAEKGQLRFPAHGYPTIDNSVIVYRSTTGAYQKIGPRGAKVDFNIYKDAD